ncbi:hypothetical protein AC579_6725 [Pseudocercospora musae]|uniref:Uncharacterized protein n=1 Tax=Pseudocercospora musae TaxID=113226 RepID=A0A139HVQ5_9PEZI|nr:hypothetical protein AC579_6725 [Pseudocercospora musae]
MRFASNVATSLAALAVNTFLDNSKLNDKNDSLANTFSSKAIHLDDPPSYPASTCDQICRSRIVFPVVYSSATIGISMAMAAQNSWDWCNKNSEICKSSITSTCNMISEKLVADSRLKLLDDSCDDICLLKELETASQQAAYWAMDWAIGGINGTMSEENERDLLDIKGYLENLKRDSKMAEIVTGKDLLWFSWPRTVEEKLPIGRGENWNGVTGDAIMLMAKFFGPDTGSLDDMVLLPGKWLKTDSSGFAKMWERLATSRAADVRNSWLGKMARAVYQVVQSGHVKSREQYPSIYDEGNTGFPTWTGPSDISSQDFAFAVGHLSSEKVPDFDATFSRSDNDLAKRGGNPAGDEIFMVERYDVHSNTHYSRYCMDAAAPGEVRGDYRRWVEVDGQGIPTTQPPTHFWLHKNQLKKVARDDFKDMDVSKDVDAGEGPSTHRIDALNQPAVAVEDKLASTYELVSDQAVDKLRVAIVSLGAAKGKKPAKFDLPELLISRPIFRGRDKIAYNIIKVLKGKEKTLYGDLHGVVQSDVRDPIQQTKLITAEEHLRDQSPEQLEKESMRDVIKRGEEQAEDEAKKQREREKEELRGVERELNRLRDQHQQPEDPEPNQPDSPHSDPTHPDPPKPEPPGPPPLPLPPAPHISPPSLPDPPNRPDPPPQPHPQPQPHPHPNPPCDPPTNCHLPPVQPPSPPQPPTIPDPPAIPDPPSPPKPAFPKIPPIIPPILPIPGHGSDDSTSTSSTRSSTSYAAPSPTSASSHASSSLSTTSMLPTGFGFPLVPMTTSYAAAMSGSATAIIAPYGMNTTISKPTLRGPTTLVTASREPWFAEV